MKIFIGAGEESSDFLGAAVIKALQKRFPDLQFIGICGDKMEAVGHFKSLFPLHELSLMGVFEILPKLIKIFRRMKQTRDFILMEKPDLVLSIDAGMFYFRLHKKLKRKDKNILLMHLNAPSVWAHHPGRAKMVSKFLSHLFTLFPFEPPYFTRHGLPTTFVGHPLTTETFEETPLLLPKNILPITVLFGSRSLEIHMLSDLFIEACVNLQREEKNLYLLIPTFPRFKDILEKKLKATPLSYQFLTPSQKWKAFHLSKAALAASGTVALELAKAKLPFTIAYKFGFLTGLAAKLFLKTPYVCLVNILLQKPIIKEILQDNLTAQNLTLEMKRLIHLTSIERETFKKDLHEAYQKLQSPQGDAAQMIADVIESHLHKI